MSKLRAIGSGYIEDMVVKKDNPHTEILSLRLSPALLHRLDRIAKEAQITRADLIRDILDEASQEVIAGMADHLGVNDKEKLSYIFEMTHGYKPEEEGAA